MAMSALPAVSFAGFTQRTTADLALIPGDVVSCSGFATGSSADSVSAVANAPATAMRTNACSIVFTPWSMHAPQQLVVRACLCAICKQCRVSVTGTHKMHSWRAQMIGYVCVES